MADDPGMEHVLRTADLILWMTPLPLGLVALSSVLRHRPVLVPIRDSGGRAPGGGREVPSARRVPAAPSPSRGPFVTQS